MEHAAALMEAYFPRQGGELWPGGVASSFLAHQYGTPLFVYVREVLDRKWNLLREALPPEFSICYSVKANPNRKILQHFLALGAGLEIASAGEFCQASGAGCAPDKILFAGPGKSESELELVLSKGIGEIHLESALEAQRVENIAARLGIRARVAVRVNPGGEAEGGAMRMGGRSAPFGIDEEVLDEVLDRISNSPHLDFRGIHIFAGTQILDSSILVAQYRKGIEIAKRVSARIGCKLHTLDFGGGLGIPYFANERPLDMAQLKRDLQLLMDEVHRDGMLNGTRLVVEPGRYLVGEAGIYVTRVTDVKVSRGKKFLIVDGGMHHHLAASGNLGQTIKRNYPVAVLNKLHSSSLETVDVVGPLCTPLDVLARGVSLPQAEPGDLVGVFQSGAYARSASPLGFLSHPAPPEVWADAGHDQLIRRRGDYSDFVRDQNFDAPLQ
jgi:diaminopimelate decarboxylase